MTTFSVRLAHLMNQRGWTQVDAAAELGVSQALISRYLTGKRAPLPRTIAHIADRLGVPVSELTGEKDSKSRKDGPAAKTAPYEVGQWMQALKRRWRRNKSSRNEIGLAIRVLFSEDSADVLAWLEDE
jgi:transcriptional regulator with XRE-family HTH domain